MSDKTYDKLKFAGLLIVPIIVFLSTIVSIWDIPFGDQIAATLSAVDVLVGAVVTIAKAKYDAKDKEKDGD